LNVCHLTAELGEEYSSRVEDELGDTPEEATENEKDVIKASNEELHAPGMQCAVFL
jgi:hypothetical protein